jgi:hypothetical protein
VCLGRTGGRERLSSSLFLSFLVTGLNRHLIFLFREFPKAGGTRCSCLCHFFFSYFAVTFSLVFSLFSFATRAFQMGFSAAFLSIPSTENKNSTPTLLHFFYKRERRSKNPKWLTPIAARCMTQAPPPPTSPGKKKNRNVPARRRRS